MGLELRMTEAVDGSARGLVVSKAYPSTLIAVFLTEFRYFSCQTANQLFKQGWVDTVPDPISPEKFLWYNWKSNPEALE